MKKTAITGIKVYKKLISPYTARSCRFVPTCSEYAAIAVERYGVWKGLYLAVKRILRCHPWHPGGFDPVP